MTFPPIRYVDLVSMGCDPMTSWTLEGSTITAEPSPPRFVMDLVKAALKSDPPSPESDLMGYVRHVRTILLSLTDYTQAADSPLTAEQRAAWATYRQSLRDLPSVYTGEGPIPWPVTPA
jgi:hypothetical protein